ncbi:hypothetical protein MATL_G00133220 [Megalops atlanticus]|uniref:Uncharacterized protein n=1 Tax=Megalops atlanticus TaxID=7932 RepID=A0A9D3TAN7_MEGAT|nr:hypothetical protein MATL_G00133220 [Megalops atlanticus]
MNKELLPLFAAMAGNDYTNMQEAMETFSTRVTVADGREHSSKRTQQIHGLLHWLSQFSGPQEALEGVLVILEGTYSRKTVCAVLSSGMKEYTLSSSNLVQFFKEGAPVSNLPEPVRVLPPWILLALAKGQLASCILDVLLLQRVMLKVQVEDFRLPSCHATSQPIRQVLYGLLLDGKQAQASSKPDRKLNPMDTGASYFVEEFDRKDLQLRSSSVPAVLTQCQHLPLEKLNEAPVLLRLQVLLDTLGVKPSALKTVPCHLSLPVCVTCYWLTHAQSTPDLQHLQALLLGLVYGELSRLRQQKEPAAESPDLRAVRQRLGRVRVRTKGKGLDLSVAHAFSQWQSCLRFSLILNQLLCFPLPKPACAWLYKGTLVHQVVHDFRGGCDPEALLEGPPFPKQLFRDLLGAVQNSVGIDVFTPVKRRGGRQRLTQEQQQQHPQQPQNSKHQKQKKQQVQKQEQPHQQHVGRGRRLMEEAKPIQDLNNSFKLLACEDDDDDDDDSCDDE